MWTNELLVGVEGQQHMCWSTPVGDVDRARIRCHVRFAGVVYENPLNLQLSHVILKHRAKWLPCETNVVDVLEAPVDYSGSGVGHTSASITKPLTW